MFNQFLKMWFYSAISKEIGFFLKVALNACVTAELFTAGVAASGVAILILELTFAVR